MGVVPLAVRMPGQVWGLAAAGPAGPVYVTSYAGRTRSTQDLYTTVLTAVDLGGTTMWQRTFPGHPYPPRVEADGTVWIAHTDGGDPPVFTVTGLDGDGRRLHSVIPRQVAPQHLGAVVRMPGGFCMLWQPTPPWHLAGDGVARLARCDDNGDTLWSTPLALATVSLPGVVEAGVHTGWQVRPKTPWKPSTLEVDSWEPLLVAGDRVLAAIHDGGSGIGVCAIAETSTGKLVSTTEPQPNGYKAIAGPGRFLVGAQGYGAFSSSLYDGQGHAVQTWPSHGMMLVNQFGVIRGPESDNSSSSRRFRVLDADGSMRDGPLLSGYYTTYPALDVNGTAVFWRAGALSAVDADLHRHVLFAGEDERSVMSRVLLLDEGTVVFALGYELFLFRGTGLGPLAAGPWPCADGNLGGNPVLAV